LAKIPEIMAAVHAVESAMHNMLLQEAVQLQPMNPGAGGLLDITTQSILLPELLRAQIRQAFSVESDREGETQDGDGDEDEDDDEDEAEPKKRRVPRYRPDPNSGVARQYPFLRQRSAANSKADALQRPVSKSRPLMVLTPSRSRRESQCGTRQSSRQSSRRSSACASPRLSPKCASPRNSPRNSPRLSACRAPEASPPCSFLDGGADSPVFERSSLCQGDGEASLVEGMHEESMRELLLVTQLAVGLSGVESLRKDGKIPLASSPLVRSPLASSPSAGPSPRSSRLCSPSPRSSGLISPCELPLPMAVRRQPSRRHKRLTA